jgi:DNA replication licensing factor MCM3
LFVVTDDIEDTRDRLISEHVLRMHSYRQPGTEEGAPVRENAGASLSVALNGGQVDSQRPTDVYEKYDKMLHAGFKEAASRRGNKDPEILSIPFMKKYIQYAKNRIKPVLTQEASDRIADIYVGLRNDEMESNQRKTSPMTVRTLETLIRLATAHAKSRLSNRVEERDAAAAEAILRFALFKEVLQDSRKKRRKTTREPNAGSGDSDDDSSDEDGDNGGDTQRTSARAGTARSGRTPARSSARRGGANGASSSRHPTPATADGEGDDGADGEENIYDATPRRSTRSSGVPSQSQFSFASSLPSSQLPATGEDGEEEEEEEEADGDELVDGAANLALDDEPISAARVNVFRTTMGQLMNTEVFEDDSAQLDDLVEAVNEKVGRRDRFEKTEAKKALRWMDEKNMIM